MIAGLYKGGLVPEGMKLFTFPKLEWAKFKCFGPLPKALQDLNTKIFREWLPVNAEYEMSAGFNIEYYTKGELLQPVALKDFTQGKNAPNPYTIFFIDFDDKKITQRLQNNKNT